ncbi:hypothetical protein BJY52DRAFT_1201940 [Lactarius psammicola]|nr:hypothetical protein BJY52DRAFT_1201940 [Lactarius psammicola]
MANLLRFAKSGSDWTANDLRPTTSDSLDPNLLSGTFDTQGLSDETYRLLQYLDLASKANSGQESAVRDFTGGILRVLGYEKRGLLLRSHYAIPLLINGNQSQSVQADVCLIQGASTILLVVQEDQSVLSARDPEPQVIAGTFATFQYNNRIRAQLSECELDSMTIPCIAMIGTRPTFYLVPVTRELSIAVVTGRYLLSLLRDRLSEVALQHFTAFHIFAKAHWSAFMVPVTRNCMC